MLRPLVVLLVILIFIRILMMRRLVVFRVILISIRGLQVSGSSVSWMSWRRNLISTIARRKPLMRCPLTWVPFILLVLLFLVIILRICFKRLRRLLDLLGSMLRRRKELLRYRLLFVTMRWYRRPAFPLIMLISTMRHLRSLILLIMLTLLFARLLILLSVRNWWVGLLSYLCPGHDDYHTSVPKSPSTIRATSGAWYGDAWESTVGVISCVSFLFALWLSRPTCLLL